jgi:tryptophan 7-halogenase
MSEPSRDTAIRNIVVVGGGLAGWYCAARLCHAMRGRSVQVRVVHAAPPGSETDPLDVLSGSTLPSIALPLAELGLEERAFMRATGATFKLATEYRDFGAAGRSYMLPFGEIGARLEAVGFHQFVSRLMLAGRDTDLDHFSVPALAARLGRFAHPSQDARSVLSTYEYAFHLDTQACTRLLRGFALHHGAIAVDTDLAGAACSEDGQRITGLTLGDGTHINADLYIDCSGPRAVLLGQGLRVPFEDWRHWLPCDRVAVSRSPAAGAAPPFTRIAALPSGWLMQTPLRGAIDNALVFHGQSLDESSALAQIKALSPAAAPRVLSFTNGRHRELWRGNCVAIGAAAGFLEPLAATGLRLIDDGIARLLALFPDAGSLPLMAAEYNRMLGATYDGARDFVLLHYLRRGDGAPWKLSQSAELPRSLAQRIELFRYRGRVVLHDEEIFEEADWACTFIGQGERPAHHSILAAQMGENEVLNQFARISQVMQSAVQKLPPHQVYLERYLA